MREGGELLILLNSLSQAIALRLHKKHCFSKNLIEHATSKHLTAELLLIPQTAVHYSSGIKVLNICTFLIALSHHALSNLILKATSISQMCMFHYRVTDVEHIGSSEA